MKSCFGATLSLSWVAIPGHFYPLAKSQGVIWGGQKESLSKAGKYLAVLVEQLSHAKIMVMLYQLFFFLQFILNLNIW